MFDETMRADPTNPQIAAGDDAGRVPSTPTTTSDSTTQRSGGTGSRSSIGRGLVLSLAIVGGIAAQIGLMPVLGSASIAAALLVSVPPILWLFSRTTDRLAQRTPPMAPEEPAAGYPDTRMFEMLARDALISERGIIDWISPSLAETRGMTPASMRGRDVVHTLFTRAADSRSTLDILGALRDGRAFDGRLLTNPTDPDGEAGALDVSIRPIDRAGRCLLIVTDATRASADATRARCMRAAIDEVTEMIFWLAPNGTFVGANEAVRRLLAIAGPELAGRPLSELFPGLDAASLTNSARGAGRAIDTTCLNLEGRSIPVEVRVRPVDGIEPIGWMLIAQDLTDRKAWETAARLSDARCRRAVENAEDGVWECDATLNTAWFSDRFKSMLGHATDEIGTRIEELRDRLHPDDRDDALARLQDHIERARPFDIECRLRLRGGEHRWFRLHTKSIRDDHGRPVRIIGTLTDINQRKQLEAEITIMRSELATARRWSQDVTDQMGHALRTPLSALMACADGESNGDDDSHTQSIRLERIREHARRLQANVDGLLTLSQSRPSTEVSIQSVVARAFIDTAIRPSREMAARQHVGFELLLDPAMPHLIETDGARVSQLLTGALGVLVRACRHGHLRTEIMTSPAGAELRVLVRAETDQPGIGPKIGPLEQAAEFRIAQKIARRLGGELTLEQRGHATNLRVRIPLGEPTVEQSAAPRLQAA